MVIISHLGRLEPTNRARVVGVLQSNTRFVVASVHSSANGGVLNVGVVGYVTDAEHFVHSKLVSYVKGCI